MSSWPSPTALANSTEKPADRDDASVTRTVRDLLLPVTGQSVAVERRKDRQLRALGRA